MHLHPGGPPCPLSAGPDVSTAVSRPGAQCLRSPAHPTPHAVAPAHPKCVSCEHRLSWPRLQPGGSISGFSVGYLDRFRLGQLSVWLRAGFTISLSSSIPRGFPYRLLREARARPSLPGSHPCSSWRVFQLPPGTPRSPDPQRVTGPGGRRGRLQVPPFRFFPLSLELVLPQAASAG